MPAAWFGVTQLEHDPPDPPRPSCSVVGEFVAPRTPRVGRTGGCSRLRVANACESTFWALPGFSWLFHKALPSPGGPFNRHVARMRAVASPRFGLDDLHVAAHVTGSADWGPSAASPQTPRPPREGGVDRPSLTPYGPDLPGGAMGVWGRGGERPPTHARAAKPLR